MIDPGPIDLQVNGYAGVDFNQDDLPAESFHLACTKLQEDGVAGFLPTIITEHIDTMCARLSRLANLCENDPLARQLVIGLHIEGPFLNPATGFRGAHPEDAIVPADGDQMNRLLDAAGGLARIVTLAPECDPGLNVTRLLDKQGVIVSGGHCDPTLEQLDEAIDAGMSMFTHCGNGCPMHTHRHDNIVQRVLSRAEHLWIGFIADGAHIPFFALRNYIRLAGLDHSFVVTDAMSAAGLGPGEHRIGRWRLNIGDDLVARAPDGSHLVGSALKMSDAKRNLVRSAGFNEAEADLLTRANPLRAVRKHRPA